jgi:ABC-type dipeptide/oligopeptide/nickel transport system permease subunit
MMRKNKKTALIPLILVLVIIAAAVMAPVLAPNDPNETDLANAQLSSSEKYPLGTDELGRCMLSRILYGARVSVFSGLIITAVVFAIGVFTGTVSGYFGGVLDAVLDKVITTMQAFPKIVLAIAIAGLLGIGIENTIIALCLVEWVEYARLSRSLAARERRQEYVNAARVCGESHLRIILKRVMPNITGPMVVNASLGIASVIMEIAALSYLGVGVQEGVSEWGAMINEGRDYIQTDPRLVLIPGIAVFVTAAAFNLFGEKLRDRIRS